ncbi:MAG: hypothetical protein JXR34_03095 [Bacteroidales bacterium]|nr:hypothetical protein [Bacteroidales bacterium]
MDFSKNIWFEANLCAVLGAIINEAQANLNQVNLINLQSKQKEIFSKNHFLANFSGEKIEDTNNTTIKYRKNKLTEEKQIKNFLESELINKPDFPKLSRNAKKEIIRSIFEIYSNAIIHGDCNYVYSCGQFFPNKIPPRIDFTIVDLGKTIQKNVSEFLMSSISGKDAIKWAISENNTTKPKSNNIPGGLGLKLMLEFVKMNKGKVQIVSSDGYWQFDKKGEFKDDLETHFPGTIANLEFNLDDSSFYYLKNEPTTEIEF